MKLKIAVLSAVTALFALVPAGPASACDPDGGPPCEWTLKMIICNVHPNC